MHLRYLIKPVCVQYGFIFRQQPENKFVSSAAGRRKGGLSRGNLSPLTVFWFLLQGQKKRHGGEPYKLSPCGDLSPPQAIASYVMSIRRKAPPLGNTSPLLRIDRPTHFYYYGVGKYPRKEHLI